jgi:hypothetical protein
MNDSDDVKDGDRIEGLEQLTRSLAPSRDLWPGIQARLRRRRSPAAALRAAVRPYPLMQFALAASLVAGVGAMFTLSLQQQGLAPAALQATLPLGQDSRAIVVANLSIVDDAERQLRQALKKHPDSQPLLSLLESTQHRARDLRALL